MKVARAYQIPHSEFLAWSDDDREKAIAHELREAQRCPTCGTRAAEWDPKQGGDRRAYVAKLETCRGCQQLESRRDAIPEGHGARGQHIFLVRPTPDPDEPDEEVTGDGEP